MAVYSHFGSIAAVAGEVCERGFTEFDALLRSGGPSDDPVSDLFCQGLLYLRFAVENPHLYTLMFQYTSPDWTPSRRSPLMSSGRPTDSPAGRAAFESVLHAVRASSPRDTDELAALTHAGVVWSTVHGLAMLSITGHLAGARDQVSRQAFITLAIGIGTPQDTAERSFDAAIARIS